MSQVIRRNWWFILGMVLAITAIVLALLYSPTRAQTSTPTVPPLPIGQPLYLELGTVYTVTSNSMAPSINAGDWVMIKPGKAKPKMGQIVLYYDYLLSDLIIHRVVLLGTDKEGWWATTKGDNNPANDWLYLRESNMIGIVKWRIELYR